MKNPRCRTQLRAKFSFLLLLSCFLIGGCASNSESPEQRAAEREAEQQRHAAQHEADEQRRATAEHQHAQDDLRHKFARYTTAELKLMDTRYKELRQSSGRDVDVTLNPLARKIWGDSDTENVEKIIEIERELLRRWKAGDKDAYLPEFESK